MNDDRPKEILGGVRSLAPPMIPGAEAAQINGRQIEEPGRVVEDLADLVVLFLVAPYDLGRRGGRPVEIPLRIRFQANSLPPLVS